MKAHHFKQFLEQANGLSPAQRVELAGALDRLARRERTVAVIETARAPHPCPRCRSPRVHRDGHKNDLQRYRCRDCASSFNDLSGTALARLRHKFKWLAYLDCMLQSGTVRRAAAAAAAAVGVDKAASFRWRYRFLHTTKRDRSVPLGGITEADETYLLESQTGSRTLSRRGLSHEHDCILVARDRSEKTIRRFTRTTSRPTDCAVLRHFGFAKRMKVTSFGACLTKIVNTGTKNGEPIALP